MRATETDALAHTQQWDARLLRVAEPLHWPDLPAQSCFVIPLASQRTKSPGIHALESWIAHQGPQ